ncbi:hypothetical protein BKA62DRAFT_667335 [Auriculariales sp. MPI-PUGE-AT-0066]|nr:hypothetical protein BKA62DRAFT_667335 [Auriculariales sp. MPI-PUGE-AT-0066]
MFTDNTILCTPRSSLDTETEARLANIQARGLRRPLVLSLAALAVLGFGATAPFIQTPLRELAALTALFTALFLAWTFYMPRLEVGSAEERIRLVPAATEGVAAQPADEPLFKHWPRWGGIVLLLLADCCILLGATNPFLWY